MKILKGWPTEEMNLAGCRAHHKVMQGFEPTGLDAAEACFIAMLAAAPPAQEAEPVGFISQSVIDGLKAGKRVQYWMLPKKNEDDFPDIDVPLYTHAPSDKLRHAAEKLLESIDDAEVCDKWFDDVENLRDALEGK